MPKTQKHYDDTTPFDSIPPFFGNLLVRAYNQLELAVNADSQKTLRYYLVKNDLVSLRRQLTKIKKKGGYRFSSLQNVKTLGERFTSENESKIEKPLIFYAKTPEALKILIEFGFNVNATYKGKTRAHQALIDAEHELFKICVDGDIQPPIYSQNSLLKHYKTAYYDEAIIQAFAHPVEEAPKYVEDIDYMFKKNIELKNYDTNKNPYLLTLARANSEKEVGIALLFTKYFLDKGLDINVTSTDHKEINKGSKNISIETAFVVSCWFNNETMVDFLLDYYKKSTKQLLKFKEQINGAYVAAHFEIKLETAIMNETVPNSQGEKLKKPTLKI